jgi:leukotriene-A4 hydrolase
MKRSFWISPLFIFILVSLAACRVPDAGPVAAPSAAAVDATRVDPHSFAEPQLVEIDHLDLDLRVDFQQQRLIGAATLTLDNRGRTNRLILDTGDLTIRRVTLGDGRETTFSLGAPVEHLGQPLTIAIRPDTRTVRIEYETSPQAAAVQWLTPEQTAGGRHPFLFTQSQAILARTWVPIQDTPGVRMTYSATVTVPPALLALMSAENPTERRADGVYRFQMPQPIPSYLLALAVGDLVFRPLGDRTGVYAEPGVIEAAAAEFVDTQQMMIDAEALYGPYRWGRYDILVLPPSFPFGGMENPRLTFATPTILAGDRSLVALIAHELAHSWSGNLVTNATWNDFWLNEGFTVYFEQRIMESLSGREYSEMLAALSLQSLQETIERIGPQHPDTHLFQNLAGRDPDDGMTDIAYNKGYFFLRWLEESVGRARFDAFLRNWFDSHAFESQTTADFVAFLDANLLADRPQLQADVRRWIHGPGLPIVPAVRSARFERVDAQLAAFTAGTAAARLDTANWSTHEWLRFLRNLPEELTLAQMTELDRAFNLTATGNSEILTVWLQRAIRTGYEPAYPALERFLTSMGRRKFVQPLFVEMLRTDAGRARAMEIYRKARPMYHPVTQGTIDRLIDWPV